MVDMEKAEQGNLEQFRGRMTLRRDEKEFRQSILYHAYKEDQIDGEFIPYLNELNSISWLMSAGHCTGHNDEDRGPSVSFRVGISFIEFFKALEPIANRNTTIQLAGWELMMPRFVFWFEHETWKEDIEALTLCLKAV